MDKEMKKKIVLLIKLTISLVILYFLFRKIELKEVMENLLSLPFGIVLFILITAVVKQAIEILNWFFLLCLNPNYKPKFKEIFQSHFIGQALRFLIPGGHAVVGKLFFVENQKKATIVSIGAEKFFQLWIILFFAAFAAFFHFQDISLHWRILSFLFILVLPIIIYFLKHFFSVGRQIFFKNYFLTLPKVIFSHTLYMLLTIIQYYVVLNFFAAIPFIHVFLAVPLILTANILPFTYAGLGLRESFAIAILSAYSIASVNAVSVSLIVFLFNTFLPALAGLGIFLLTRKR
jgi:glycosyltransferase 2 family protein